MYQRSELTETYSSNIILKRPFHILQTHFKDISKENMKNLQ